MEARRQELVYEAVRTELDGLERYEIEQRACLARTRWQSAPPEHRAVAGARAAAIGRILIHLRRTWTTDYDAADHAARALAAERVGPEDAARVRAAGHPVGARVEVVGEERTGVVQQVLVSREDDGSFARWYVVHVAELQLCRAYGCDELETLETGEFPVAAGQQHAGVGALAASGAVSGAAAVRGSAPVPAGVSGAVSGAVSGTASGAVSTGVAEPRPRGNGTRGSASHGGRVLAGV